MSRRQIRKSLLVISMLGPNSCGTGETPISTPAASSIRTTSAGTETNADVGVQNKTQVKSAKGPKTKGSSSRKQIPTVSDSADALANTGGTFGGPQTNQNQRATVPSQAASNPSASPLPAAQPPVPAISDCYKGDEFTCKVEIEIVRLTNEKRVGLSPLRHDKNMAFVARDWSRQQGQSGGISHNGFPRARAQVYQQEFGQSGSVSAENVAMFSGGSGTPPAEVAKRFVDMWYGSSGHRANMLGRYGSLGAGIYKSGFGYYGTQIFGN